MGYSFEAAITDIKAEDDLNQMITCVLDLSSKANKAWELHAAY